MKCFSTSIAAALVVTIWLVSCVGCSFSRLSTTAPLPIAFNAPPTMEQVVTTINANTHRVQQLHSDSVSLSMPRMPIGRLSATLDVERLPEQPARFRLGGELLGSHELDMGSNGDEYWIWMKRNQPPTVLWGRHAEFHRSAASEILPVPPSFIIDALGLVTIDPSSLMHDQPYESSSKVPGVLELQTRVPTPRGNLTRVFQIDQEKAAILQQTVYDTSVYPPRLLAVANASDFMHDPRVGVVLPRKIEVRLPPAQLGFDFKVDNYIVNEPNPESDWQRLWSIPRLEGHQYLDLADPAQMQGIRLGGGGGGLGVGAESATQAKLAKPVRPDTPHAATRLLNRILR